MAVVNWTNVTNWNDVLALPNTTTEGWFWSAIVYMLFIVATLIFSSFGFEIGILSGVFLGLVTSLFLAYMDLVTWGTVQVFIALFVIIGLYLMWKLKGE